jgi:hypothetical protein
MATNITATVNNQVNLEVDDDFTGTGVTQDQITCQVKLNGTEVPPSNVMVVGSVKQFYYNHLANGDYSVHVVDPTQTFDNNVTIPS